MVRALSIEVSAKKKWKCQTALLKLYSRAIKDPSDYPNGIRLRFVKLKQSSVNHIEKSKIDKLRMRQKKFLADICSNSTDKIIHLDYSSQAGIVPTLRQMIMSLMSTQTSAPLFHYVDLDWCSEGFTLQFSSKLATEAETTVNIVLTLLMRMYPKVDVQANFDENALYRCQHMKWDERRKMVIYLLAPDESEDFEKDEELICFEFDIEAVENNEKREQQIMCS